MSKALNKIVITGGHHTTALSLVNKIQKELPDTKIYWFGHKTTIKGDKNISLEYKDITNLNIPFYELKAGKFYKTKDIKRLLKIPVGFFHAFYLLYKIKPDVIMSFGGYLAAPTVIAGWMLRIPSYTHEQTVVVGYSNKLISKFVKKIFISWPQSIKYFDKSKVILCGTPLRPEIYVKDKIKFNLNLNLPTIYVTGGKTGSHIINDAISQILPQLLAKYNVIHQCGDTSIYNDFSVLKNLYSTISAQSKGKYVLKKFVLNNEIGSVFEVSNLCITRSGANTTAELLALNKPALMIPISWVSHNEQFENAQIVKKAGLGEILQESELTPEYLLYQINKMLDNIEKYSLKDVQALNYINLDSTTIILTELIKRV